MAALWTALPVRVFGGVWRTEMVNFRAFELGAPPLWLYVAALALGFGLIWKNPAPDRKLLRALLPTMPFAALWFAPASIWMLTGCGFGIAWAVFRLALAGAFAPLREPLGKVPQRVFPILGILIFILALFSSHLAYNRLYLNMSDWGVYAQTAWNTLRGDFLLDTWPNPTGFSCGHFMPTFFLIAIPLFAICPSPWSLFVLNALCLTGGAGLLYWYARKKNIPANYAAALGIIYLLSPSLMNLNLCLFYGFNPVVLFIPLYILFSWSYDARRFRTAWALMIASLLLKETFGVFWCGWGMAMLLRGNRKSGIAAILLGTATFLFAARVFFGVFGQPYIFDSQFQALGGSLWEIALSPVLRPEAFWGQLLREKNALFLLLLLLPTFPLSFNRPWLLLAPLPLLIFNCLRGSEQIVNLVQQYQLEAVLVLEVLMVQGFSRLNANNPVCRILRLGMSPEPRRNVRFAAVAAGVAGAFTAGYCFGQSFQGMNNLDMLDNFGDGAEMMREVRVRIPAGVDVAASNSAAVQLLFRNRTFAPDYPHAAWLFYEIQHPFGLGPSLEQHLRNLEDPNLELLYFHRPDARTYFVFRRTETPKSKISTLPVCTASEWAAWGLPLPVDSPVYSARALPGPDGDAEIRFRLEQPTGRFGQLQVRQYGTDNAFRRSTVLFGDGAHAPSALRPGVFWSPGRIPWRPPFHTCTVHVTELP